jgi:hypothetical protein
MDHDHGAKEFAENSIQPSQELKALTEKKNSIAAPKRSITQK